MSEELRNCPFCGGERVQVYAAVRNSQERIYPIARCMGCYLDLPGKNDDYSYDGKTARAAWNTRTPDTDQAEIERLRDALQAIAGPTAMAMDASDRVEAYRDIAKEALNADR